MKMHWGVEEAEEEVEALIRDFIKSLSKYVLTVNVEKENNWIGSIDQKTMPPHPYLHYDGKIKISISIQLPSKGWDLIE